MRFKYLWLMPLIIGFIVVGASPATALTFNPRTASETIEAPVNFLGVPTAQAGWSDDAKEYIKGLIDDLKLQFSKSLDIKQHVITILLFIIGVITSAGIWLVWLCSMMLGALLSLGKFITNDYVQVGWPFIQGIANLGFIFALLFIAFSTVLQIDMGGGIKRLLPRLLFAAVMINFSLVIGGILIDISRVLMAILIRALDGCALKDVGVCLLGSSQLLNLHTNLLPAEWLPSSFPDKNLLAPLPTGWDAVVKAVMALILTIAMAVGMLMLTIGLFVRFIMLTLLLIVSPIAYLSLAFPGLQDYSKKWWSSFLQYTFYGPVALFILILAVRLTDGAAFQEIDTFLDGMLSFGVMLGMLFAAFKYSKTMSGSFAAATMSIASKEAWKRPGTTGMVAAGLLGGGIPTIIAAGLASKWGKAAGTETARQTHEFAKPIRKTIRKGIQKIPVAGKIAFGPERDKDGKLLKGESSLGQTAGRWVTSLPGMRAMYPKGQTLYNWERDMKRAGAHLAPADVRANADIYDRINTPRVGTAMSRNQGTAIIDTALEGHPTEMLRDFDRLLNMVRNPYAFNNVRDEDRARIGALNITTVANNINTGRAAAGLAPLGGDDVNRLERRIEEIKKSARNSLNEVTKDDWV